ncbi:MAG: hypothetical protein JXA96_01230, partial [Sedimentisphaerales bacterium]|nr:hypothetical protein [Sedimentisphaerales bacterium]
SLDSILAPDFLELRRKLFNKYSTDKTLAQKVIKYLAEYRSNPSFVFTREAVLDDNIFVEWKKFKVYIENYLIKQLGIVSKL